MPPAKKRSSSNGTRGKLDAAAAARRAVEQVAALTGRPIEGVLGLRREDEGWTVTVELVELRRIPETTDVLASYDVQLDERGELREYQRTRRYARGHVEDS